MGAMENAEEGPSLQVRLKAGVKEEALRAADGVELSVPQKMGRKALRQLLIHLLELPEDNPPDFHFLVSGEHPLRTTLAKYLLRRNISAETTLELTYYIPLPIPEQENPFHVSDEWLSAIHAVIPTGDGATPLILTGSFSGSPSVLSPSAALIAESVLSEYAHDAAIKGVSWVDGGKRFLTTSQDQTVRLWSCNTAQVTAEPIAIFRSGETDTPTSFSCMSASTQPSQKVAVAMGGADGSVWVIPSLPSDSDMADSKASGKRKSTEATRLSAQRIGVAATDMCVTSATFRGDTLMSAGWDGLAREWDLENGAPSVTIPCGGKAVTSLSASDTVLLVSAVDGAVRLVDARDGKGVVGACGRSGAHAGVVSDACWVDVGRSAVSGGLDGTLRFWDVRAMIAPARVVADVHEGGGRCLAVCATMDAGRDVVFSAGEDGKVAAVRL